MEAPMISSKLVRAACVAFVGLFAHHGAAVEPHHPPRDWQRFPPVIQIDAQVDIIAVGDVHGDYGRLVSLLAGGSVIAGIPPSPDRPTWKAGQSVLILTGDLIDKGPNALAVLTLLRALSAAAARDGGRVVVLMGNHEAEFLASRSAAKGEGFAKDLSAAGLRSGDVANCGGDIGRFLCSLPFAARVNDWFFSHAGNTDGRTLEVLSSNLENGVDRDDFASAQLIGANSLLEARIGGKAADGRSWFETGSPGAGAERLLAGYAAALGVRHIVEGHHHAAATFPDGAMRRAGEMFNWRGKLFLIDTGMSREINDSTGAILRVRAASHDAVAVCADGSETLIWDARQDGRSAKAAPCRAAQP
jgi:hypothetical protein